jgi:hypothetical protein
MMRDDNEQAIAPLPDAPRKSRAQMTLLNQAMREDELSRKALREAKRLHEQACELREAAYRLEE